MVQKYLTDFTGVVLAGGKGKRLGIPKAFVRIDGKSLLDSIVEILTESFQNNLVISGEYKLQINHPGVSVIRDLYPSLGPIGGLITALKHSSTEWIFMTGCDYPMLRPELIRYIACKALKNPQFDLVIPYVSGYYQVLHAAYNKRIEGIVESRIAGGRYSIKSMIKFTSINVLVIPELEIKEIDPQLQSFVNINTPGELEKHNLKVNI